jgi:hypothetical protein
VVSLYMMKEDALDRNPTTPPWPSGQGDMWETHRDRQLEKGSRWRVVCKIENDCQFEEIQHTISLGHHHDDEWVAEFSYRFETYVRSTMKCNKGANLLSI